LAQRDIIVIGGSAGSFEPLRTVVSSLPASLPASILIVVHMSPDVPSFLDENLSRFSRLPVIQATDNEPIRRGHVYVARPDYQFTVERGRMRVQRGPRENRHRPAIDPLFRSAAREYGPRVIGVILSGRLDDGSMGLYAVKQRGGIAVVQDPDEATAHEMPSHALAYATPHYVLRASDIGSNLINLVQIDQDEILMPTKKSRTKNNGRSQADPPDENLKVAYFDEGEGTPSVFACPECHGVLWELKEGDLVRFRCRVGHSFGPESLAQEFSEASEAALWAAMRALEEKAAMQRRIADGLSADRKSATRLRDQSTADDTNARIIREIIFARDSKLDVDEPEPKKKTA
jgi:two-component system, chemotaxis family, protein-glutamate methylesterase/glutaminase